MGDGQKEIEEEINDLVTIRIDRTETISPIESNFLNTN